MTLIGAAVVAVITFLMGFWLGKDKGYKQGLIQGRQEKIIKGDECIN